MESSSSYHATLCEHVSTNESLNEGHSHNQMSLSNLLSPSIDHGPVQQHPVADGYPSASTSTISPTLTAMSNDSHVDRNYPYTIETPATFQRQAHSDCRFPSSREHHPRYHFSDHASNGATTTLHGPVNIYGAATAPNFCAPIAIAPVYDPNSQQYHQHHQYHRYYHQKDGSFAATTYLPGMLYGGNPSAATLSSYNGGHRPIYTSGDGSQQFYVDDGGYRVGHATKATEVESTATPPFMQNCHATLTQDFPVEDSESRTFTLKIRQQPERARICGFGEKDRRPLDPPPIVELQIFDKHRNRVSHPKDLNFFVLHASLLTADGKEHLEMIEAEPNNMRVLMGSLISSIYVLQDTTGDTGFFFVFPDLSVRTEGHYRLKLSLMNVSMSVGRISSAEADIITSVVTEPFRAYTAKKFPGMLESNELMKCFANQGLKLVIRKEKSRSQEPEDIGDDDPSREEEEEAHGGHHRHYRHHRHRHHHHHEEREGRRATRDGSNGCFSSGHTSSDSRRSPDDTPRSDGDTGSREGSSSNSSSNNSVPPLIYDDDPRS